jgi:hypothetical protein
MSGKPRYPSGPEQSFDGRAAADQEAVDRAVSDLDVRYPPAPPRAASKVRMGRKPTWSAPPANAAAWAALMGKGDPVDGPVTTATVLDAAPEVGRSSRRSGAVR